jgi:hypothetical protein
MEIWVDDNKKIIGSGFGIAQHVSAAKWDKYQFPDALGLRKQKFPEAVTFLAGAGKDKSKILFGRGQKAYLFSFEEKSTPPKSIFGSILIDGITISDDRLLVVQGKKHSNGSYRAEIVTATIESNELVFGKKNLELPAPKKVVWPEGLVWEKGEEPWPESKNEDEEDEVRPEVKVGELDVAHVINNEPRWHKLNISRGPHGITVASNYSGIIAVFDEKTLEPKLSVRLPTQQEAYFSAIATASGVLVTIVIQYREAALLHFDAEGHLIGSLSKFGSEPAFGLSPAILVNDDLALITQNHMKHCSYLINLKTFEASKTDALGDYRIAGKSTYSSDFKTVSFAVSEEVEICGIGMLDISTKKLKLKFLKIPNLRSKAKVEVAVEPDPVEGEPKLALSQLGPLPKWECSKDDQTKLEFEVANHGGVFTGIYVQIEGDVVQKNMIDCQEIKLLDQSVSFEKQGAKARAEIPSFSFAAAMEKRNPKRKTSVIIPEVYQLSITLKGVETGAGLMMIRTGPLGMTVGSAMQGKSMFIK